MKRKCSGHATTKLLRLNTTTSSISGSESESDDSEAEYDLDPRLDLENYKEILITAQMWITCKSFRKVFNEE